MRARVGGLVRVRCAGAVRCGGGTESRPGPVRRLRARPGEGGREERGIGNRGAGAVGRELVRGWRARGPPPPAATKRRAGRQGVACAGGFVLDLDLMAGMTRRTTVWACLSDLLLFCLKVFRARRSRPVRTGTCKVCTCWKEFIRVEFRKKGRYSCRGNHAWCGNLFSLWMRELYWLTKSWLYDVEKQKLNIYRRGKLIVQAHELLA
jgi:hypothetical protein